MKKFLPLFLFLLPFLNYAQALSGNYVIGSGRPAPFNTLTNAVNRLNTVGVAGAVTFLLDNESYSTGEVFPIRITQFTGSSAVNTLRIKPNVGKTVTIKTTGVNTWTAVPAVFQIDGADNIIIDGSNANNGTTRNLTLVNDDNVSWLPRTGVWISSNNTNGANNIRISHTKLAMTNRNNIELQLSGIFSGSNNAANINSKTSGAATAANSNLTVRNNEFFNVRQGMVVNGSTQGSLQTSNVIFSANTLGSTIDAQKPSVPLHLINVKEATISQNTFVGVANTSTTDPDLGMIIENGSNSFIKQNTFEDIKTTGITLGRVLWIKGHTTNLEISENKISNVRNTTVGQLMGIHVDVSAASSGILLANNFISDLSAAGETTNSGFGIYIGQGVGTRIYHNTVAMNTNQNGWGAAIYFAGGTELDVRNNIFTNTSTTGTPYAIWSAVSAPAFTDINYNDYWSANIGYLGSPRTTLENWKAATVKDGNSLNILPIFTSVSDLHLKTDDGNKALDDRGQPLAVIATDIDQQTRSTTAPDMGADEFSVAPTLATKPTSQATNLIFNSVTPNGFTMNWTKGTGTGTGSIVVIRAANAVNWAPVNSTAYTANTVFGSGFQMGAGNYVVHSGAGNTVTVTGLAGATNYHVAVYEFNGTGATSNYLTTSPGRNNQTTLNPTLGWQITTTDTVNTLTFDTTISGVNNGPFSGTGVTTAPTAGQLNSNAFSFTGFDDGDLPFGGSNSNLDFKRGTSNGGVTAGGVYAFNTGSNKIALGIQPTAKDLVPEAVTLRFQNQTTSPITSISVGYKVYIYNDQEASSSFNFSHSANNTSFTAIPQLNVTSREEADTNPAWKASYRVATITGLSIPPKGFYYLKWSGSGTATLGTTLDEFALDDILLSANPTNNFVSFSGTAENFTVHGNTGLSGATTVNGDLNFTAGKLSIGSNTLTIAGSVTNTVAGALQGSASSNVIIAGTGDKELSFDQTTPGTTNLLNDFSIPFAAGKANSVSLLNNVVINRELNVDTDHIFNLGTTQLTGTLSKVTVNGTLRTQNITATPIPTGKTFLGTGTVIYDANDAAKRQTLVSGTYNNLTLNSVTGTVAGGDVTVNGVLHLPQANPTSGLTGSLDLGTYTLTMGINATNTGLGDVTGITQRNGFLPNKVYTFGNPHTSISFPNVGTLPTTMSLKTTIGAAPSWRTGAIKRHFDLIQTGGIGTKAVIRAHYADSELNDNNENKLVDFAHIFPKGSATVGTTIEQGRSNYNTSENWVELTNVNIGLYFTNSFGEVNLTLDEPDVISGSKILTWNGSKDDSFTTAENWTPAATPSDGYVVIIPDAAKTPNDPILNPEHAINSMHIEAGGIVNSLPDSKFTLTGGNGAWINNGKFNPGTGNSEVIFTNIDATIAGTTDFNNVTINSDARLLPLSGNVMRIAGAFNTNGRFAASAVDNTVVFTGTNQDIPLPSQTAMSYHNLIINGSGAIFPTTLGITGDLTVNSPVDFVGKTIEMSGNRLQQIGGTGSPILNNLTVNNTGGGVQLNADLTVNGLLTLTSGRLNIGAHNLTLGSSSVSGTFGVNNMIVADGGGFVRRSYGGPGSYFFPIGDVTSNAAYSPITVDVTAGEFTNAYVAVSVVDSIHPDNHSKQNYISRYWQVKQSGITNAVATITADYVIEELLTEAGTMAAAQLTGTFNQQTNPWKRFSPLNGTRLIAGGATLPQNVTSYFTGIKGGEFTATISGGGSYCANQSVTLTTNVVGGDMPYTYEWSGVLGDKATAAPTTSGTYTVTVRDANGIVTSAESVVNISLAATAGTLSISNPIACLSANPDPIELSDNSAPVLYWERSEYENFINVTKINSTATILSGAEAGIILGKTYFRAVVGNSTCGQVYTNVITVDTKTSVWNNGIWSEGVPDIRTAAVILQNYPIAINFNACNLTVADNAKVTVAPAADVILAGALTIGSGSFIMESNTNLIQTSDAQNYGNITVKRESAPLFRLDYTMWGSPVTGTQTLKDFSPSTLADRFYTYDSATDVFKSILPAENSFTPGKGYLIRMPNNHVAYNANAVAKTWPGSFVGTPNNGPVNITLEGQTQGQGFNMVANPYASMVNANQFFTANSAEIEGTLYFWRRRNATPTLDGSAYYATYTAAGGTAVPSGTGVPSASSQPPNGFIQVGQGFIVQKKNPANTGNLLFTNAMRTAENDENQFFRNAEDRSRIWLNVTNVAGEFGQTLIAYMGSAENGVDRTDGKYLGDGSTALTSWLDNTEYIIQGRAPFTSSDAVALNFRTLTAGSYTIAIDHVDGIFSGNQNIFLRDRLTGVLHNLKASAYNFATDAGSFNSRFEVVYQNGVLSVDSPAFDSNSVVLYKKENKVFVSSQKVILDQVEAYDLNGRLLAVVKNINSKEVSVNVGTTNQVLIFKITSVDGVTISKKIIN